MHSCKFSNNSAYLKSPVYFRMCLKQLKSSIGAFLKS